MKAPVLLLSAALIFWGWQTGMWIFAIPMAAILSGYRLINSRWDFSPDDFRRIANLCLMILIIVFVSLLTTQRSIYLVYTLLQWFPLVFFPLLAAQTYSVNESIDIRTLFVSLKNLIKAESNSYIISLGYPYFALCILSAGVANTRDISFYIGMFLLTSIAFWYIRSQRFSPGIWLSLILLAGIMGFIGQIGVYHLQQKLEDTVVAWLSNNNSIGQLTDSTTKQTSIGEIGTLKQSNEIIFRVAADSQKVAPGLLKEATYDKYKSAFWVASNSTFTPVQPEINGKSWRLGNNSGNSSKLTISATLNQGKGLLRLADGTFEIEELPVSQMEKNKYGTVKVEGKTDAIAYRILFNKSLSLDSPPTEDDLQIAKSEREAVNQIIRQLDITGKSPQAILERVDSFLIKNFRYSLKLTGKNNQSTPLSTFLLKTRAGHCEYFATATTLLLRAAGIPARYAVGYSVHEFSQLENQYIVRSRHAHAWTLAYINGRWQAFDTTPADWTSIENANASKLAFISDLWSFFSFKLSGWLRSSLVSNLFKYGWWLILPLIFLRLWKFNSKNQVRRLSTKQILTKQVAKSDVNKRDYEFYLIEKRLQELGLSRHPSESLKNWIKRLEEELPSSDLIADLTSLVELHYRDRFDPQGIKETERARLKSAIQAWLVMLQKHFHHN
ncbi:MAG: transglutaminase domain-containing protein [Aulosira sp. ZfuVER01]|nr:transglutaminase domain-containing protein [Aulosira sp. ZfuVER01]MDZ8002136.1 transglutaminase domain-containing protein [Aulosira sp. DedVER01a]MDZ8052597.1 transglutaminase domain-containing protein [Aulosira sp. ZfuCHP01]